MSQLFSPYALGPLHLKNRIAIAPMCQYSATDGLPADWHMIHLGNLALSGAALLILEATAVSPEGRISAQDLGLWSDEHRQTLQPIVAAIRRHSPIALGVQLAHAGRKASSAVPWEGGGNIGVDQGGWQTLAPSAVPHADGETVPLALDEAGLAKVRADFVAAAHRVHELGIEAIELHAAHGYLLHQFLSPLSNHRDDRYGGSLENRMRFPLEVFDAVREAVPRSVAVGVRISASDWVDESGARESGARDAGAWGSWDIEQSVVFANELKRRGTDFMHVSSGGVSPRQTIPVGPGYQVGFAERIRRETGLPTIGVGLITEAAQAETIVAAGQADMVALARGILYDPRWPWHAAAQLGAQVDAPPQYWRCQPHDQKQLFGSTRLGQR